MIDKHRNSHRTDRNFESDMSPEYSSFREVQIISSPSLNKNIIYPSSPESSFNSINNNIDRTSSISDNSENDSTVSFTNRHRPLHHDLSAPNNHRELPVIPFANSNLPQYQIATVFDGALGATGIMFDVKAKTNSIAIMSFSFFTKDADPQCNIQVYAKSGSHVSFETDPSAWRMVLNTEMECMGTQHETVLEADSFSTLIKDYLIIQGGSTSSFYITCTVPMRYSKTSNANQVFVEDEFVQIFEGTGLASYFNEKFSPRTWNGMINYAVEEKSNDASLVDSCNMNLRLSMLQTTASYGHMFNIRVLERDDPVIVSGFEIHTPLTSNVNYEIYTLPGGMEGGTLSIEPWILIGTGQVIGKGEGIGTNLPVDDPVTVGVGHTQGFYITLDEEALFYSETSLPVGEVYAHNQDIVVEVGSGVGDYPLGDNFFYPRIMNGRVLYKTISGCPTPPGPTSGPLISTPLSTSTITFIFNVNVPKEWNPSDVFEEINSTTKGTISGIIQSDSDFQQMISTFDLHLGDVASTYESISSTACGEVVGYLCRVIKTEVRMNHKDGLDVGMLNYSLLRFYGMLVNNLDQGALYVKYAGDKALSTSRILTLKGVPSLMGDDQIDYFQKIAKEFLAKTKQATESGVDILSVQVDFQQMKQPSRSLFRKLNSYASIDISTFITGKHKPPPEIDFDLLIEDSINADPGQFADDLKEGMEKHPGGEYFKEIQDIETPITIVKNTGTLAPITSPLSPPKAPINQNKGGLSLPASIGIVFGAAVVTFSLVFGAFILRKRRIVKRRFKKTTNNMEENSLEDEDPLFLNFLMKRRNSDIMEDFSGMNGNKHDPKTGEVSESSGLSGVEVRVIEDPEFHQGSYRGVNMHNDYNEVYEEYEFSDQEEEDNIVDVLPNRPIHVRSQSGNSNTSPDLSGRRKQLVQMASLHQKVIVEAPPGTLKRTRAHLSKRSGLQDETSSLERYKRESHLSQSQSRRKMRSRDDVEAEIEGRIRQKYYQGSFRQSNRQLSRADDEPELNWSYGMEKKKKSKNVIPIEEIEIASNSTSSTISTKDRIG